MNLAIVVTSNIHAGHNEISVSNKLLAHYYVYVNSKNTVNKQYLRNAVIDTDILKVSFIVSISITITPINKMHTSGCGKTLALCYLLTTTEP